MSKQINTENIIKEKFDSREFTFDESAWAEAEAMIDAQNPGGKKKFFWIFSIALLLGLITGGIWIGTNMQSNDKAQLAETQPNLAAEETTPTNGSQPEQVASSPLTPSAENSETVAANNAAPENKAIAQSATKSSGTTASAAPASKSDKTAGKASNLGNSAVKNNPAKTDYSINKETVANNNQLTDENIDEKTTTNTNKTEATPIFTEPYKKEASNEETPAAKNEEAVNTPLADSGERTNPSSEDEGAKSELVLAEVDSSFNEPEERNTGSSKKKRNNTPPGFNTKNSWSLVGGLGVWDVYSSTLGKESSNGILGPVIGVGYEAAFNKRYAVGVNLLYMSRGALNFRRVFNSEVFDVTYNDTKHTQTVIEAINLHFVNVPIFMRFSINRKHHLVGGLSYAYLIGSYYTEKNVVTVGQETRDEGTKKKFSQYSGFMTWDIIPFIGYEASIKDRLKLSAQFHYGLNDMTDDSFKSDGEFNNTNAIQNAYDRNLGVQVMLRYDLFKH